MSPLRHFWKSKVTKMLWNLVRRKDGFDLVSLGGNCKEKLFLFLIPIIETLSKLAAPSDVPSLQEAALIFGGEPLFSLADLSNNC